MTIDDHTFQLFLDIPSGKLEGELAEKTREIFRDMCMQYLT